MIEQPENLVYKRIKFFTEHPPSLRLYLERKQGYFIAKRCFDILISMMVIVLVLWFFQDFVNEINAVLVPQHWFNYSFNI